MPRALAVFLLALLLGVATLGVPAAHSASPDLVVSQVYAGKALVISSSRWGQM